MKNKLVIMFSVLFLFTACEQTTTVNYDGVESAGKRLGDEANELYGNAYVLGSDKSVDVVMEAVDAYNSLDAEKEMSFYSDEYVTDERMEGMKDWHSRFESLNMQPWATVPIRLIGDDRDLVLVWSVEDRVWKDGSKHTQDLFEVFPVNDEGKIDGFSQWRRNRPTNEFGLSQGGKFIGLNPENEYSGRPFVFSNRGEVETMEKFLEAANNLDVEGFSEFIKYPFSYNGVELTKEDFEQEFSSRESQSWKPWAMIPIKISNTDPTSGLIVHSRAEIVRKDGSVTEFEAAETYFFDLDGKITGVNQFTRAVPQPQTEE